MKKHKTTSHGKGHAHQGKVTHKGMSSLIDGHGSRDPHASAEHHAANAEHGMSEGLSPQGGYDDGGEEGGAGMGENCSYE